ncbi:XdhC family protein [Aliiglaciecola sp. CAU 1673]|uniref:XdhC family protein n=1 Tax=Aliiglaciecola sp. CAU 1673 TaxID=3032595 RepID=UPI0023DA9543|nr:XdhC/CoxI family protein [Aliiglaciecola sp. CAU 1673]MDF2177256.1 XdhC family protein [Aliiglaciecola sp. CAU 1673]
MANQLIQLLSHWHAQKDQLQWVLATVIGTEGSAYRKAGAMMLINHLGQYHGLLSGGCLEADIMRQARRCLDDGQARIIQYDMQDEDELAWQLGCGGLVRILLQPVSQQNQYLALDTLFSHLSRHQRCGYWQQIAEGVPHNRCITEPELNALLGPQKKLVVQQIDGQRVLLQRLLPPPHLAVFGGGVDARPVVAMAKELGWQVSLLDPRPAYAREPYFQGATRIIREPFSALTDADWLSTVDAAVLMTHNVQLDAEALTLVNHLPLQYLGLLGPVHRTERVLKCAGVSFAQLRLPLASPIGLRLGGELPESIALAILAEIHAQLEKADACSISGVLGQTDNMQRSWA